MNSTMTLRRNRLIVGFGTLFGALFFLVRILFAYLVSAYVNYLPSEYSPDVFLFVIFAIFSTFFLATGFASNE